MAIGDMLVAGQRMADQHRVGFVGVERAIGLVGDRSIGRGARRRRVQRVIGAELSHEALRRIDLAKAGLF